LEYQTGEYWWRAFPLILDYTYVNGAFLALVAGRAIAGGTIRIGWMASPDLKLGSWASAPGNPALRPSGTGWEEEEVTDPTFVLEGDSIKIAYTGEDANGVSRIGVAEAGIGKAFPTVLSESTVAGVQPPIWETARTSR